MTTKDYMDSKTQAENRDLFFSSYIVGLIFHPYDSYL